jgi:hypothetical protein
LALPDSEWSLIGLPSLSDKPLTSMTVYNGNTGVTQNFSQAVALRWVATPIYGYDRAANSYLMFGFDPWHDGSTLRAWRGYWLMTCVGNLTLKVPAG